MQLLAETAVADQELTETDAERLVRAICFKTGPPGTIGAELEWLVSDLADPLLTVPIDRIKEVLSVFEQPESLPGAGLLTLEPGGQVELSTAPAAGLSDCLAAASADMAALREAFGSAGLALTGRGLDPLRTPRRVLDLPRYAAMEEYFDRRGPWGRLMMCSTASVQVCVDAGLEADGASGYAYRWQLLHALGPVLVAAFANSPMRRGRPTGWKCTRQLIWSRLDPCRTHAPPGAEPSGRRRAGEPQSSRATPDGDPRRDWISYALDAEVLCQRAPDGEPWTVPTGITFRDWLQDGGRRPTAEDLGYHLSTLFPPVRARGHLELRMIDAQQGDAWMVPVALVAALADDPAAAQAAMAATERVWHQPRSAERAWRPDDGPWLRAARLGPADQALACASKECFAAADAALAKSRTAALARELVAAFADRYVDRGRCPADDTLEDMS